MKNTVRPIDANALARKIREYMADFPTAIARLRACGAILSMLGDENQTPTLSGIAPDCNGEPLTLEQLREMDGKPVWSKKFKQWFLILKEDFKYLLFDKMGHYVPLWSDVIDRGLYAYPPARIDREKWEPCELCRRKGEQDPCYENQCFRKNAHQCNYICDKFLRWREVDIRLRNSKFCPRCGRPLTPEAWEELEKRLNPLLEPTKEG